MDEGVLLGLDMKKYIIIPVVIVAIVAMMILNNRKSILIRELPGPRAGVNSLYTVDGKLIAISRDNDVYSWDWTDMSSWPQAGKVVADIVTPIAGERLLYVPKGRSDTLIITNLKGDKELKRLTLPWGRSCQFLVSSASGRYAAAALIKDKITEVVLVETNPVAIRETVSIPAGVELCNIAVSNDGRLITAVGSREGGGFLLMADSQDKKVLWQKTVADCEKIDNIVFSPDGNTVFAGEELRFVYALDCSTGQVARKYEVEKHQTVANQRQRITALKISYDGVILVATMEPNSQIWLWNTGNDSDGYVLPGYHGTSDISFSPDSSLLAAGSMVSKSIQILKIPDEYNF